MTSKVIQTFTGNDVVYKVIKDGYKTVSETIHVTDSMPTRSEYNLSPSSVIHNPNLNYTIDSSHTYPPVITFNENVVTPDNVEITKNEYLLAPYGQDYLIIDDQQDDNFYKVGNVEVNNYGVVNNFNTNGYVITNTFNLGTSDYEIVIGFKILNQTNDYQMLMHSNEYYYFNICVNPDLNIHSNAGNSTTWYAPITGNTTLQLNTNYLIKVVRTSSIRYMYLSSDNGETWVEEGSVEDTYDYSKSFFMGITPNLTQINSGEIDLSKTYVKINGELIWEPTWNKLSDNYLRSGSLYDYNGQTSNYANNSGENFVKIMNFLPGSQPFEIKTKIYLTNRSQVKYLFGSLNSTYANPRIQINTNGTVHFYLSGNGSSYNISNNGASSSTISLDVWHTIRFIWNGSSYRFLVDNEEFWSKNSTTPLYRNVNDPLCLGCYNGVSRFESGKIDLSETYIYYNGVESWSYKSLNKLNVDIYNSPVIEDNKIISGFTTSNCVQMKQMFNPGNNPWLMQFKFKQDALDSTWRALFGNYYGDWTCGAHFYTTGNGGISFELTSTNSSWNITGTGGIHAANVFTANKWYWARLEFTGSSYNAYISDDGITFRQISTLSSTTPIKANQRQTIGCDQYAGGNQYLNGSIDLSESYIKINDEYWWKGTTESGKHLPGILDSSYEDTGNAITLKLYDVETNDRTLILNTNRNVNVLNKKFVQYDGEIQIPDHGLSVYNSDTHVWSKYRFITLNVDNASTAIYTEGNI